MKKFINNKCLYVTRMKLYLEKILSLEKGRRNSKMRRRRREITIPQGEHSYKQHACSSGFSRDAFLSIGLFVVEARYALGR